MNNDKLEKTLQVVGVRYIGTKPKKTDNVCKTGIVWSGFGDIQKVPIQSAQVLCRDPYKQIWQLEGESPPENPTDEALSLKAGESARLAVAAHKEATARRAAPETEKAFDVVEIDRIMSAIGDVCEEKDLAEHFETNGMPKLASVRAKLNKKISPLALQQAWDEIKSSQAR